MKKADVVSLLLQHKLKSPPVNSQGLAFAPTNIALCKYWGKRDTELNLPVTSSLSITLPDKGALTTITLHDKPEDIVVLNEKRLPKDSVFVKRLRDYLDLFRTQQTWHLHIQIKMNIPVSAGLASSACGFAALISAMNDLFQWELSQRDLSILARLGSGSAARSFWNGFVEWSAGVQQNGMDSYGHPLDIEWSDFYVGLLTVDCNEKALSSREAMQRTVDSSPLYSCWPKKVSQDLAMIKHALQLKNFSLLAGTAESNALTMHATMLSSWPAICYWVPETLIMMRKIWDLRRDGLPVYFTQDAGANLKLLYQDKYKSQIQTAFPEIETIKVFE